MSTPHHWRNLHWSLNTPTLSPVSRSYLLSYSIFWTESSPWYYNWHMTIYLANVLAREVLQLSWRVHNYPKIYLAYSYNRLSLIEDPSSSWTIKIAIVINKFYIQFNHRLIYYTPARDTINIIWFNSTINNKI